MISEQGSKLSVTMTHFNKTPTMSGQELASDKLQIEKGTTLEQIDTL